MDVITLKMVFLSEAETSWKKIKQAKSGWLTSAELVEAVKFFINSLDEAIKLAETKLSGGETKKEFVLDVVSKLYDMIIIKALPTWAYWISPLLKSVVIDNIVSNAIDWIVSKYNAGEWKW